ncbi:recombination-associated protein RdgC [Kistimonas asteriae]|uniref:recombination-associated protein RdgC n=1 Tax=Kistimonas asteriae TaxID=517724 RepID=UPI001BA63500|nr:recombination-associated protein RdgC [Kistimonas asteriae]
MWFKNLILYRFSKPFEYTAETLEEKLAEQRFRPCSKSEMASFGWVSPVPDGDSLIHASGQFLVLTAKKEEKLLPASVVRDALKEKVDIIEQEQGRKVFKKEKDQLKDEITRDLLPRAFSRSNRTSAYIDSRNGWLIVDASSFRKAEELTSSLRSCLGSLPVLPPALKSAPSAIMTHWLQQSSDLPAPFILGDECELKEPGEEGGIVRCKRVDLLSEEVSLHLTSGKVVSRIAMQWDESIDCILGEDLCIKRLKFTDTLQEQSDALDIEDKAGRFDADFTLMSLTLERFLSELINALGGEDTSRTGQEAEPVITAKPELAEA